MNEIPWDLLFALAIPALFSVGVCVVLTRLPQLSLQQRQSLAVVAASCSGAAALFCINEFPIQGSPLLQVPGALIICVPVIGLISALLTWRGGSVGWPLYGAILLACLGLIHGLSFPWWNRGFDGWLHLALSLSAGLIFGLCMQQACIDSAEPQQMKPRLSIFWWALHCAACAPLLISLTALGHAQALLICVAPLALLGLVSKPLQMPSFASNNQLLLAVIPSVLLANASMRYVASPDDPAFIQLLIRCAALSFCLSSFLLWLSKARSKRSQLLLRIVAGLSLAAAGLAAQYAYAYNADAADASASSEHFYYQ